MVAMKPTKPDWAEQMIAKAPHTFMKRYMHDDDIVSLLHIYERRVVRIVKQMQESRWDQCTTVGAERRLVLIGYKQACDDLLAALRRGR